MNALRLSLLILLMALTAFPGTARRPVSDRPRRTVQPHADRPDTTASVPGWQLGCVCVSAADSGADLRLKRIAFSGFDKPASSLHESFFVSNHGAASLVGFLIEIEYLTMDGRQLHRRNAEVRLHVPPGEARRADIRSFDRQQSFRYYRSPATRRPATPFKVRFRILRIWIGPEGS